MDGSHVTWAGVAYALIVTLPAIIAAVVGLLNRKQLKTGNGKTVGHLVEDVHAAVTPDPLAPAPVVPIEKTGA